MSKPVVKFSDVIVDPVVGWRSIVRIASSHHTLSDEVVAAYDNVVTTSTVKEVNADGSFETQNTLYVPLPDEQA